MHIGGCRRLINVPRWPNLQTGDHSQSTAVPAGGSFSQVLSMIGNVVSQEHATGPECML